MDLVVWRERLGIVGAPHVPETALVPPPALLEAALPPAVRPEGALTPEAKLELGRRLLESSLDAMRSAGAPISEDGLAAVCGPLESFFALGLENASDPNARVIDRGHLIELLAAVLADRFDDYRFRREDEPLLACLSEAQRKEWKHPAEHISLRLSAESKAILVERAKGAVGLASAALVSLEATLGSLEAARARHSAIVDELRNLDKDDRTGRISGGEAAALAGGEVKLLEHLTELSRLDPEAADPKQLELIAKTIARAEAALGSERLADFALALKTDDLECHRGRTFEDPPASLRLKLSSVGCMTWPDATVLSECIDANKHMICTESEVHGVVQGTLRIVEDRSGRGPLLVLERLYPDHAVEEKRRLIEHALRRAEGLGVPLLLPEEYFWSCSAWVRVGMDGKEINIPPMNDEIRAVAHSFGATLIEPEVVEVKATIGPIGTEYIDSAPLGGAAGRGKAEPRRYGPMDALYDNSFAILVPKTTEWRKPGEPPYEFEPLFPPLVA